MESFELLKMPIPIIAAVLVPQLSPELLQGTPGWLATTLLGVWITLWFLDRVGRLPGRPQGERRSASFSPEDREKLDQIFHLLAFRNDEDGIERFLKFLQESRMSHATLVKVARSLDEANLTLHQIANKL